MNSLSRVVLAAVAAAALAGTRIAHPTGQTAPKTLPPDQQAYRAAWQHEDPQQQIDALKKVAADFPSTRSAQRARMSALRLLVKIFPSRAAEITNHIDAMLKSEKPSDPGPYDDVATILVDAGVLLDKAQDLSGKTVHAFKEKEFLADLKREYAEAKIERPDDAHLLRSYRNTRAALLGTLGRIYLAQGRTDRAAKIFAEAERNEPTAVAAAGLGTLAYAAGREDAAYDYFLRARLTGALSAADDRTFEALFAKRHGTDASPERTLDDAYRSRYANPIHVTPYAGPPSNGRASLLEMFTGAGCPPCAGADLAVDAVRERYSPRDLVVLMHHVHIPRPDPMTNVDTVARSAFYAVQAAPTFVVDGIGMQPGGSSREDAERPFGQLTAAIEEALKEPPHARIALALSVSGRTVRVRADVTDVDGPREELMLRLALVERELAYGGENGIRFHPMVVRSLLDRPLASASGPIDAAFDLDHIAAGLRNYLDGYQRRNDRFGPIAFLAKPTAVDVANVGVVAFVQRDADRRVLQSAYMAVGTVRSER